MIAFICYFFPAVFYLWLYEALTKNSLNTKQCIFRFCSNAMFINLGCFGIKKYILHTAGLSILYEGDMLPQVAFNYIVMSLGVAVVLLLAEILLSKNVKITVEEDSREE